MNNKIAIAVLNRTIDNASSSPKNENEQLAGKKVRKRMQKYQAFVLDFAPFVCRDPHPLMYS